MDLTNEQQARFAEMLHDYEPIDSYMRSPGSVNYAQFDYDVVHELPLFMLDPDFSFDDLEAQIDVILNYLPSIKRIFEQPFIHLKEENVIMPIEAVRVINNATLTHTASHSQYWGNIEKGEIRPNKLLTRVYEDNYGIYENLVFCSVVDDVLSFARNNIRFLKELVYTNQTIEINLLERVNHLNYFLALGKLHIGYSKSFDAYYPVALRCVNKLQFILNTITPRLKRPVYKKNKHRPRNIKIHKTNILAMHKEYHRIYKLSKALPHACANDIEITDKDIARLEKDYFFFCQALCLFAIGHFNFTCDEKKSFDFKRTMPKFQFKEWTVELAVRPYAKTLLLEITINKDKPYKIVIIPTLQANPLPLLLSIKSIFTADEFVVCSPLDQTNVQTTYLDITSIESFRRVQQIVLRGMIYSDETHDECPFCSNKLTLNNRLSTDHSPVYECTSCRTEIHSAICKNTGKPFYFTKVVGLKQREVPENEWLAKRQAEASMYFRNITAVDEDNEPICPHCNQLQAPGTA